MAAIVPFRRREGHATSRSSSASSRSRATAWRIRRETCICETPTRVADLRLREVLREAQAQHLALALGQHRHQALDRRGVLGEAEARVLDAHRVGDAVAVLVVVARAVERDRPVGARRLARLEHALDRDADVLGDLRRRRRAAERARELLAHAVDADGHLLQVARHAHRPAAVAEVALELAEDRRHRERGERGRPLRLEAVDRLQQAERGDLDQVVERLAAALVAPRKLARQRQEALHERLARGGIAVAVVALEQPPVLTGAGRTIDRAGRICSARPTVLRLMIDRLHALPRSRCLVRRGVGRERAATGLWVAAGPV